MESLSPAHREVLELVYDRDLRLADIAERLGVPLGTVKTRVHHALRGMRRALEEWGWDAG
jgi:RNA polymerase sigma-70 factor, ECF subfamily